MTNRIGEHVEAHAAPTMVTVILWATDAVIVASLSRPSAMLEPMYTQF